MLATCQAHRLLTTTGLVCLSKSVFHALPEIAAAGEDFHMKLIEVLAFDCKPGVSLMERTLHLRSCEHVAPFDSLNLRLKTLAQLALRCRPVD